jgi:hypothetical protein
MARSPKWLLPAVTVLLLGTFAAWTMSADRAASQSLFERMVMPGPLVKGHAELEKTCRKCHAPFSKQSQDGLCLACHDKIAADVRARTGFHGRRPEVATGPCKHCHTDHKGRDADVVGLDPDQLDHHLTDFVLNGSHRSAPCSGCHQPGKKFAAAPGRCIDCHKADDPHGGKLGDKCETCHAEARWRDLRAFDHQRTKFPLKGAHQKVACDLCHAGERYKDLATDCQSCHGLQDVHRGELGRRCDGCHTSDKWQGVSFDHDRKTRFPLRGKHRDAKCRACHEAGAGTPTTPGKGKKQPRSCAACHAADDAHKGQLGKDCGTCHNSEDWRQKVAFDHDLSRFPLIGLHGVVPCAQCHLSASYRDAPRQCVGCHKDEFHRGRLGDRCAECHNPNGWTLWQFDHGQRTGVRLEGAHAGLDCHACHATPNRKIVSPMTQCAACHQKDDTHQGAFGPNCSQCHDQLDFKHQHVR